VGYEDCRADCRRLAKKYDNAELRKLAEKRYRPIAPPPPPEAPMVPSKGPSPEANPFVNHGRGPYKASGSGPYDRSGKSKN
jgi:hypothetical protein